uniref:heme oxygenase (biliverdin-producing) n=1 Tax=Rhodopseudomonas palustris (strain BisA53) TaxID=316055 RepID=Q07RY8_RHOP5
MTAATASRPERTGIVAALYVRTRALHLEAEQSGIIADILRGEASPAGYVLLLRNLHAAYDAMEQGLARHYQTPGLARLSAYRFDRAGAIGADLAALCGDNWRSTIPLLPAGEAYADAITRAAEGDGSWLIAHAYTRYLGDLSGGQIVQKLLAKSMQLRPDQLSMYAFAGFPDPVVLKSEYRHALEEAGADLIDPASVVEQGATAFTLNIALSVAVKNSVAEQARVGRTS